MEENKNISVGKGRLAESINPEIGNGSVWEENPHFSALRNVDPAKKLESFLDPPRNLQKPDNDKIAVPADSDDVYPLDEGTSLDEGNTPREEHPVKKNGKKHKHKHKKKDKKSKDSLNQDDIPIEPEAIHEERREGIQDDSIRQTPSEESESRFESAGENLPTEGKRVKRIIQAAEEESVRQPAKPRKPEPSTESVLSPFTYWLKNLRGSEYVHPYNDDYALDQLANSTKGGISETFADLLAGQGYREQAIEMYKLLMTRFPEKSSFFAAKIEALK